MPYFFTSDRMFSRIQELVQKAQSRHREKSGYHPERYLTRNTRLHLTCHLLGTVKNFAHQCNLNLSISQCRAVIEADKGHWPNWNLAIWDSLPPAASEVPHLPCQEKIKKRYSVEEAELIMNGDLEKSQCVQDYLNDLNGRRFDIWKTWQEACKYNPEFLNIKRNILAHNAHLYNIDMIIAFALAYGEFHMEETAATHSVIKPKRFPNPFDWNPQDEDALQG